MKNDRGEEEKKIHCEIYGEILNKFWNGFYEIKFNIKKYYRILCNVFIMNPAGL